MDNKKMIVDKTEKYTMTIEVDQNMTPLLKINISRVNGID
jgi:hypothetical protein